MRKGTLSLGWTDWIRDRVQVCSEVLQVEVMFAVTERLRAEGGCSIGISIGGSWKVSQLVNGHETTTLS